MRVLSIYFFSNKRHLMVILGSNETKIDIPL